MFWKNLEFFFELQLFSKCKCEKNSIVLLFYCSIGHTQTTSDLEIWKFTWGVTLCRLRYDSTIINWYIPANPKHRRTHTIKLYVPLSLSTSTSFTGYYDWLHNTLFQAELQSPRISGVLYRFIIHLPVNWNTYSILWQVGGLREF